MVDFVVVRSKRGSGYDELWEIRWDRNLPVVEFGPIFLFARKDMGKIELVRVYGKRLGGKIWKAYIEGNLVEIEDVRALVILKAIDDFMWEEFADMTDYFKRAKSLVVYKLKV